jgi:hypothetical protein
MTTKRQPKKTQVRPPPMPVVPVVTDAQLAEMSPVMRDAIVAALVRAVRQGKRPGEALE